MLRELIESYPYTGCAIGLALCATLAVIAEQSIFIGCADFASKLYSLVQNVLLSLAYLFNGANVIDRSYILAKGLPFEVVTPGRIQHMVTSPLHMEEINRAPLDVLSLHAVAKDFLQPKSTMHGFEWNDVRGVEGTGFVRALRTILTSQLPRILPDLDKAIASHIRSELERYHLRKGSRSVPVYEFSKRVVTCINCYVFFGRELAEDPEFYDAAYNFPQDSAFAAEMLRVLPKPLAQFIAGWFTRNYRSSESLHRLLSAEIKKRTDARGRQDQSCPNDGLQWLIETAPKKCNWSTDRLVGEVMGIWYGSVHTLSIAATFALLDLYSHPDCIDPLRKEAKNVGFNASDDLPLLDSFLSESARLNAFESTGIRRQALQPFTFSDGLHIRKGEWVCVPHRSMMRDEKYFTNAMQFDRLRFLNEGRHHHGLTAASRDWLVWGLGRIVCPGRFYATAVLKLMLAKMLIHYDCEVLGFRGSNCFQWRSAVIPKSTISLLVRDRAEGGKPIR
ncbi:hypothetical protein MauCBS54593_000023 [Microsporum audouinii]